MTRSPHARLVDFIHHESTAGLVLVIAALAAMVAFNIEGLRPFYDGFLDAKATFAIGDFKLSKPLLLWINDGLMAVFFFLVGLEIKREVLEGSLSTSDQIILPAVAATGGMAAPAIIYSLLNAGSPELMRGWAIPAATDIAFALGALSLLGSRVPIALKVFLLTVATLDDLGAIVIIAIFYTEQLSMMALAFSGLVIAVLALCNRFNIDRTGLYVCAGFVMWVLILKSGVHATLAGVALAFTIPMTKRDGTPMLQAIEENLHSYVKFFILPVFAFANAGIPVASFTPSGLAAALPFSIAAGLVVGKPLGILCATFLAIKLRIAELPEGCTWAHVAGVGCLAGIGFTMSLFIGGLAFEAAELQEAVRVGVVAGSVISTVLGVLVLMVASRPAR